MGIGVLQASLVMSGPVGKVQIAMCSKHAVELCGTHEGAVSKMPSAAGSARWNPTAGVAHAYLW